MKVLIATPTYSGKDYALEKHLESIKNIDYDNCNHIMVDNTDDDGLYTERLKKLGVEAYHVPRDGNSRNAICNSMNFVREYCLMGKYDYVLVVESDLFPDKDVINRLIKPGRAVVGSYYLLGFEEDDITLSKLQKQFMTGQITRFQFAERTIGLRPRNACLFIVDKKKTGYLGSRQLTREESQSMFQTGLQKVHGVGLGCTLIRQDIIRRFPFWVDNQYTNKHHDVYFYLDLQNAGIPVFVDTDVLIVHQPSDWNKIEDR